MELTSVGCSETVMTGDVIVALTLATPNKEMNWIVQHGITLQQLKKAMENVHLHTDFHVKEMLTSMVRLGSQISEGKHRQYLCGLAVPCPWPDGRMVGVATAKKSSTVIWLASIIDVHS